MKLALTVLLTLTMASTPALAITFTDLLKNDVTPKSITYKTVGADVLTLDLYSPADLKPGEKRPVAVWIHGGGWLGGDATAFDSQARYFATRGIIGVSINYRLLGNPDRHLKDCISDCKSAIRYLRAHAAELNLDPDKIVALGDSAGGHLVAACGLLPDSDYDDEKGPAAGARFSGAPNLMVICNGVLDLTGDKWIHDVIGGVATVKNSPESKAPPTPADMENAKKVSPLYQVRAGLPPSLVMHGEADTVVEPQQSIDFTAKMKAAGNDCTLILVPGARHAFIIAKYTAAEPDVVKEMRRIDDFLVQHGYLTGAATLEVSPTPAWVPKVKPAPKPAAAPPAASGK